MGSFSKKSSLSAQTTFAAFNIRLRKDGKDLEDKKRLFRLDVLDHGKVIYTVDGYNQIAVSHFMFRTKTGLPDPSQDPNSEEECKYQYVL
jgi:hypothetical protein